MLEGILGVARRCYGPNAKAMAPWHYNNSDGHTIFVPRGTKAMHAACWSDQGVLDAYFTRLSTWSDTQGRAHHPIPLSLNTVSYEAYEVLGARTVQDLQGVAILHHIRPKPWNVWECDTWWGLEAWCDLWRRQPLVEGQEQPMFFGPSLQPSTQ